MRPTARQVFLLLGVDEQGDAGHDTNSMMPCELKPYDFQSSPRPARSRQIDQSFSAWRSLSLHGVKPDEPAPSGQLPLSDAEPSSPQPPAPDPSEKAEAKPHYDASGLKAQIDSMRSYAQPDPLDQFISFHFPGALPVERAWLRNNQHHLNNPALIHSAAAIAMQRGCPRGSEEFMRFCGQLLDQHYAAMQAAQAPAPSMPEAPPPAHEPMPAHVDIEAEHSDSSEPEEAPMPQHYAAPVSRDPSQYAVEHQPSERSIRLTPEQRDIAARSGISESEYAKQLLRMIKLQKAKAHE